MQSKATKMGVTTIKTRIKQHDIQEDMVGNVSVQQLTVVSVSKVSSGNCQKIFYSKLKASIDFGL